MRSKLACMGWVMVCAWPAWATAERPAPPASVPADAAADDEVDATLDDALTDSERSEVPNDLANTIMQRAATFSDRTTLGGFGEHALQTGSNEVARFMSLRYGLLLSGQITERICAATEVLLAWGGTPVKRSGIWQGGEVRLAVSVVDVALWRGWAVRAGVLLVPVGTVNRAHDGPSQELVDLPIAYTSIVPAVWSDVGVGLAGTTPLANGSHLHLELYVINGLDARIADGPGLADARPSLFEDNNRDKALTGRLAWAAVGGSEVGISGYYGAYDPRGRRVSLTNLDVAWRRGAVEILAEAVWAHLDPGYVQGFTTGSPANSALALPTDMLGYYVQALYRFSLPSPERWLPADLQDTKVAAVLRYEGKDTDVHNSSTVGDARRLSLGVNVRPAPAYVVKAAVQVDSAGADGVRPAYEPWQARFWKHDAVRFAASVAYLF